MWSSTPLLAAFAGLAIAGCASLPPPPLPQEPTVTVAAGLRSDAAPSFRLRPGDAVRIDAETEPGPASWQTTLDAQGTAHVPGTGSVRLGGLDLAQAEVRIQSLIRERDRLATIALHVTASEGQRATVIGAVTQQGSVSVTPGMRVSQLIAASGLVPGARCLSARRVAATRHVAERLGVEAGTRVVRLERVRTADGVLVSVPTSTTTRNRPGACQVP